jgi:hypothetical protein
MAEHTYSGENVQSEYPLEENKSVQFNETTDETTDETTNETQIMIHDTDSKINKEKILDQYESKDKPLLFYSVFLCMVCILAVILLIFVLLSKKYY